MDFVSGRALHIAYDHILENGFEFHTLHPCLHTHGCTCLLISVACVDRVIAVREQYTDNKKPKTTGPLVRTNRPGVLVRKGLKTRRINKVVPGNKAAGKTNAKEAKTEKATPNGTAKEATEGDAKPAEGTEEAAVVDENKPSKYEEIPVEMLVCKVCKKASPDAKVIDSILTIIFYNALIFLVC